MDTRKLNGVMGRLKLAFTTFRAALDRYDQEGIGDGQIIIDEYLDKFVGDRKHAPAVRRWADETIAEIKTFNNTRTSITTNAVLLHTRMDLAILHLTAMTIDKGLTGVQEKLQGLVDGLHYAMTGAGAPPKPAKSIEEAFAAIVDLAASLGDTVALTHTTAANVIDARSIALKAFKGKNVKPTLYEVAKRIADDAAEQVKKKFFEKTWQEVANQAAKTIADVAKIVIPAPFIQQLISAISKIMGYFGTKTDAGPTDTMMTLLDILRDQNKLLEDLARIYDQSNSEIDRTLAFRP